MTKESKPLPAETERRIADHIIRAYKSLNAAIKELERGDEDLYQPIIDTLEPFRVGLRKIGKAVDGIFSAEVPDERR